MISYVKSLNHVTEMFAGSSVILDILRGALSILLRFIIHSFALFAKSLTGGLAVADVRAKSDSPFFSAPSVIPLSLSSVTSSTFLGSAITSNGCNLVMGLFVHTLGGRSFAVHINPSLPVINSSIMANLQLILGTSLCINTISPTLTVW